MERRAYTDTTSTTTATHTAQESGAGGDGVISHARPSAGGVRREAPDRCSA